MEYPSPASRADADSELHARVAGLEQLLCHLQLPAQSPAWPGAFLTESTAAPTEMHVLGLAGQPQGCLSAC